MRLLPLLLILMALAAAGCGESKDDKAMAQVCSARADISKQVDHLKSMTITTATTSQVTDALTAIQNDLKKIGDARKNLADENRQQIDQANQQFTSSVRKAIADVGTQKSLQDAATQLQAAFQDLADSYRNTFGQISCS